MGDVVEVRVIRVDLTAVPPRITLSRRRLMADPVAELVNGLEVGATISGVVRRLMEFGAFVEIAPGIEGLVHISEISHDRVFSTDKALKIGEEVQAKILALDLPKRRISLSIKALKDAPVRQESQGRDGGRDGGRSGGRDRGEAVQPREADPSMRKLLSKFGGNDKNLKGGLS